MPTIGEGPNNHQFIQSQQVTVSHWSIAPEKASCTLYRHYTECCSDTLSMQTYHQIRKQLQQFTTDKGVRELQNVKIVLEIQPHSFDV